MNQQKASRLVAVLATLVIMAAGVVSIARWTLVPVEFDGRVASVGYVDGTAGHLRTIELADGRSIPFDQALLEAAGGPQRLRDAHIVKVRWQRVIYINGAAMPLLVTLNMWRTFTALTMLTVAGWWLRK